MLAVLISDRPSHYFLLDLLVFTEIEWIISLQSATVLMSSNVRGYLDSDWMSFLLSGQHFFDTSLFVALGRVSIGRWLAATYRPLAITILMLYWDQQSERQI